MVFYQRDSLKRWRQEIIERVTTQMLQSALLCYSVKSCDLVSISMQIPHAFELNRRVIYLFSCDPNEVLVCWVESNRWSFFM